MSDRTVDVLVPVAVDSPYTYSIPDGVALAPGDIVAVPLGTRRAVGCVWPAGRSRTPAAAKLKPISAPLDAPPFSPELVKFIDWVADYTLAPRGMVLRMALKLDEQGESARIGVRIGSALPKRKTAARERVLSLMADGMIRTKTEAAREAGVTPSVVNGLLDEGALEAVEMPPEPVAREPDPNFAEPSLTAAQEAGAKSLRDAVAARKFSVHLIDGVTGSGKTEVYFEAVAETIRRGKQALILLPEIALTARFLDRFADRFGVRPAEWHSQVSPRKRGRTWDAVARGDVAVVAGARSALFLPFRDIGLIVVDEEHDPAYKQEDGVHYHARDMAVVRARLENCPIVLSSATPSLETFVNARSGKYEWLKLSHRYGAADMPSVKLVDLRKDAGEPGQYLSPSLRAALTDTLAAGEQALLFLNRRGYAPLTLCKLCGHKETCRNCSAWMVEHRYRKRLVCHHCAFETAIPERCPQCDAEGALIACGPGVERIEEEFRASFPDARIAIASSDTFSGPAQAQAVIRALAQGDVDVLIGTQIVAKGHHFPQLTLAGIIDADLGGSAGDPRAAERSFQLLHQVAGRSGRGEKPGQVLIQTRNPEDPVMQALARGSRDNFLDQEARTRERNLTPPFGRLAALIVSGTEESRVRETGRALALVAPKVRRVSVWGPAPAFYQVLRGRTRERLLVQAEKSIDIQAYLRAWLAAVKVPAGVRVTVDVDPVSFF